MNNTNTNADAIIYYNDYTQSYLYEMMNAMNIIIISLLYYFVSSKA